MGQNFDISSLALDEKCKKMEIYDSFRQQTVHPDQKPGESSEDFNIRYVLLKIANRADSGFCYGNMGDDTEKQKAIRLSALKDIQDLLKLVNLI